MFLKDVLKTLFSKALVLLINFAILILTTNYLGLEGRGLISIITADVAIIAIFNNILSGSSVVYFIPKVGLSKLLIPASLWIFLSSFVLCMVFSVIHLEVSYFVLLALTIITSLLSFNLLALLAKENIRWFNIFSFLHPALLLIFNLYFIFCLKVTSANFYLLSYFLSQFIVLVISILYLRPFLLRHEIEFRLDIARQVFKYGFMNELSYLIQFLNYRLSYFLILYFINIGSVGLFSVAIAIAEAIWLIAKSITTVQYSKMVNYTSVEDSLALTKKSVVLSFWSTLAVLLVVAVIPTFVFGYVFGKDFNTIKPLLFLLMPGILAIAVSNVYGHYFAVTNQMKILILKSSAGLVCTVILSFLLIPRYGLIGASVVTTVSYLVSSGYLGVAFYKKEKRSKSMC
jgi:O-antigen/teichoic acid export membrane protein